MQNQKKKKKKNEIKNWFKNNNKNKTLQIKNAKHKMWS